MRYLLLEYLFGKRLDTYCDEAFRIIFEKNGFTKARAWYSFPWDRVVYENRHVGLLIEYDGFYVYLSIARKTPNQGSLFDPSHYCLNSESIWIPGYVMLKGGREPQLDHFKARPRRQLLEKLRAIADDIENYCKPLLLGDFTCISESWSLAKKYDRIFYPWAYK